ncbi:hypothetical protein M407DRAFT_96796 [Tulasnella calospora MUT 4182]|uniref:Uncharacterized protein n=1 Tax=Tulasnella calospora MUT 4182 TaxID=1051891 RepID=A0A0C3LU68_9AGAM|nr:hypothetical protein M407DRAFT_96796 [Tulasnella calospora MUT 4182]
MICRRFGFLGRRPVAGGGLAFDLDDSLPFDHEPNFGETPKIYDFSMNRNLAGDASTHWTMLIPVSARQIEDHQGTQKQEGTVNVAGSSPSLSAPFRLRRIWKPKSSNPLSQEQRKLEPPADTCQQISTAVLIAMPGRDRVSPSDESEALPDIVLGVAEVYVEPSLKHPPAKTV